MLHCLSFCRVLPSIRLMGTHSTTRCNSWACPKVSPAALFVICCHGNHSIPSVLFHVAFLYLPPSSENAGSLCKVYADNLSKLQETFRAKSLRGLLCHLLLVSTNGSLRFWRWRGGSGFVLRLKLLVDPFLCIFRVHDFVYQASRLESVDWRVDYILGSSALQVSFLVSEVRMLYDPLFHNGVCILTGCWRTLCSAQTDQEKSCLGSEHSDYFLRQW